jgi:hypothetical protein
MQHRQQPSYFGLSRNKILFLGIFIVEMLGLIAMLEVLLFVRSASGASFGREVNPSRAILAQWDLVTPSSRRPLILLPTATAYSTKELFTGKIITVQPQMFNAPGWDTNTGCNSGPAKTIEFFYDGTYTGDPSSNWKSGMYELVGGTEIRLRTGEFGLFVFDFKVTKDTLTLVDSHSCEFVFQKVVP